MIPLWNAAADTWAAVFVPAFVQNTVFLAAVLLLLHALRRASARLRYSIGLIGLLKLFVPPFVPWPAGAEQMAAWPLGNAGLGAIPFASSAGNASGVSTIAPAPTGAAILFVAWIAVIVVYLGAFVLAARRLHRTLRDASLVDDAVGAPFRVFRSEHIAMPLTYALRPRDIFVPAAWESWSPECRRHVVRHEAAHLHRRDGIVQAVQAMAVAIYFAHPLVILLNRRLQELREMVCDDAATGAGSEETIRYSCHLMEIAEILVREPARGQPATGLLRRRSELAERIHYQINRERRHTMSPMRGRLVLTSLGLLALFLSWRSGDAGSSAQAATQAGSGQKSSTVAQQDPKSITLDVAGPSSFRLEGEALTADALSTRLSEYAEAGVGGPVVDIVCEDAVTMDVVRDIQAELGDQQLTRVRYRTADGDAVPLVLPSAKMIERTAELPPSDIAVVQIDERGGIRIDGEKIADVTLTDEVTKRLTENEYLVISIETEDGTRFEAFVSVMGRLQDAGAQRVIVR